MKPASLVPISDFCQTGSGTTPSRQNSDAYYGGSIPWVKSGELRESEITDTEEHVTELALAETSLKRVPAGALLVAMYGATVGRVGILGIEATTNQAVCHIIPDPDRADNRYVFHAFQHKALELVRQGVGGAQPNISQGVIKQTKIRLPSISEQKRLTAILDQADALRRLHQCATDRLAALQQAIFYEMFGDPSTNPMGWPIGSINDLTESTQYGTSSKAGAAGEFPILRMGNITRAGRLYIDDLKYIDLNKKEIEKYTVKNGDILFNRTNSPDLVGKTVAYRGSITYAFAGYLIRLRTNAHAMPEYVSAYLNCAFGKKLLRGMCKAIIGMANINAKELRSIPIPIAPMELQRQFTARLFEIEKLLPTYEQGRDWHEQLFASLQHRAFQGEL